MAIPTTGLIHKYDLKELYPGPTVDDQIGNLDCGTNGNPVWNGLTGNLTFTNQVAGVYSTQGQYANITTDFTVSVWFRGNSLATQQLIFNNGQSGANPAGIAIYLQTNGQLNFTIQGVVGSVFSSPVLLADKFYNATYTFTNNILKFYLDGVLISTNGGLGNLLAYSANSYMSWGGFSGPFFTDQFTNNTSYNVVLIYNTALNDSQVVDIFDFYYSRILGPAHSYDIANPASYPGSGSVISDIGNTFASTMSVSNATYNGTNFSFALNGTTTSYCRTGLNQTIFTGSNNFTIQYWFNNSGPLASPPYNIFLTVGARTTGYLSGYTNSISATGELVIGSTGIADYNTGFFPTIGTWYQITITVNSSNLLKLYVNGTVVYQNTITFTDPDTLNNSISIGTPESSLPNSAGYIQWGVLNLYRRLLTPLEIINFYIDTNSRFNNPIGPITSYDPIDPSSYNPASPTVMLDTVGNVDLNLANLTYDAIQGTLSSTTILSDYGRSSNGSYPAVDLNDFWSASIWVKPNSTVNNTLIFGIGGGPAGTGNGTGYIVTFTGNGTQIYHTTTDVVQETFSFSWNTSEWYNFTFTYDGLNNPNVPVFKVYANGTLLRTLNWGIRDFDLNPAVSNLAYNGWFNASIPFFVAPLDNNITKGPLKIWNIVLSSGEVVDEFNEYTARFPPPSPPPYLGSVGGRRFGGRFAG